MTITHGYASSDDLDAELFQGPAPTAAQATQRDNAINGASRRIDRLTGRKFWQDDTVVAREYFADDYYCLESRVGAVLDISTTTGLIVALDTADDGTFATTLTINTDFILLPLNAADIGEPYTAIKIVNQNYSFPMSTSGRPGVRVTAKHGWATTPDDVKKACILDAVQLYKSPEAAMNAQAAELVEPYGFPRVG